MIASQTFRCSSLPGVCIGAKAVRKMNLSPHRLGAPERNVGTPRGQECQWSSQLPEQFQPGPPKWLHFAWLPCCHLQWSAHKIHLQCRVTFVGRVAARQVLRVHSDSLGVCVYWPRALAVCTGEYGCPRELHVHFYVGRGNPDLLQLHCPCSKCLCMDIQRTAAIPEKTHGLAAFLTALQGQRHRQETLWELSQASKHAGGKQRPRHSCGVCRCGGRPA